MSNNNIGRVVQSRHPALSPVRTEKTSRIARWDLLYAFLITGLIFLNFFVFTTYYPGKRNNCFSGTACFINNFAVFAELGRRRGIGDPFTFIYVACIIPRFKANWRIGSVVRNFRQVKGSSWKITMSLDLNTPKKIKISATPHTIDKKVSPSLIPFGCFLSCFRSVFLPFLKRFELIHSSSSLKS